MYGKCIFQSGLLPTRFGKVTDYCAHYIFNEDLILTYSPALRIPDIYLEPSTRYLLLCNRFTRSWTAIKFPAGHSKYVNILEAYHDYQFFGFFRPTVIAMLYGTNINGPLEITLELWQLSENLDSARIVHAVSIDIGGAHFFPRVTGFFPLDDTMHIVFSQETDTFSWRGVVLECTTSANKPVHMFMVDHAPHVAMMYNGKLYLLCNDINGAMQYALYEYNNGILEYVTPFTAAAHLCCTYSASGSKLFALTTDRANLVINAISIFDVSTLLWTKYTMHPHFDRYMPGSMSGGEIFCYYDTEDLNGREIREIRILSILPPKLSVLALRAVQENMCKEPAKKIALEKGIDGSVKFVKCLLALDKDFTSTV